MNTEDFIDLKDYNRVMLERDNKDYMEGYINAMIDYKIINTSQAEELQKMKK